MENIINQVTCYRVCRDFSHQEEWDM